MMSRLSSITLPPGRTITGTVPLGDAAIISAGLSRSTISRSSTGGPPTIKAIRARMA
jgi:hypothetical protein